MTKCSAPQAAFAEFYQTLVPTDAPASLEDEANWIEPGETLAFPQDGARSTSSRTPTRLNDTIFVVSRGTWKIDFSVALSFELPEPYESFEGFSMLAGNTAVPISQFRNAIITVNIGAVGPVVASLPINLGTIAAPYNGYVATDAVYLDAVAAGTAALAALAAEPANRIGPDLTTPGDKYFVPGTYWYQAAVSLSVDPGAVLYFLAPGEYHIKVGSTETTLDATLSWRAGATIIASPYARIRWGVGAATLRSGFAGTVLSGDQILVQTAEPIYGTLFSQNIIIGIGGTSPTYIFSTGYIMESTQYAGGQLGVHLNRNIVPESIVGINAQGMVTSSVIVKAPDDGSTISIANPIQSNLPISRIPFAGGTANVTSSLCITEMLS